MTTSFASAGAAAADLYAPLTDVRQLPADFGETVSASFRHMVNEGQAASRDRAFRPLLHEREQTMRELGASASAFRFSGNIINTDAPWYKENLELIASGDVTMGPDGQAVFNSRKGRRVALGWRGEALTHMLEVQRLKRLYPDRIKSDQEILDLVTKDLAEKRRENMEVMQRGGGFAQFVGAAGGAVTDPRILATLPVGAGTISGFGIGGNFARALALSF